MTIDAKVLQEWEQLAEKVLPQGEWKPGRRDLSWFNARGEAQANVYHKTMKDGLHLGQPLPLTIATCHAGETELCDPQATAEFIAASRAAVPALIAEVRRLQADNASLVEAQTHELGGYEELVNEREIYRSRWLGCEGEKATLQADNARMREALLWIVEDGASDARAVECARDALAESDKP